MSTQGKRDFRPFKHFAPRRGWINDPNGLVYDGRQYHLFAQHNPAAPSWGPMHWLHAVSGDLVDWRELGVAIAPDPELGMIFSGSAAIDSANAAGFGPGAMICMFTHHGAHEQQSIAWSADGSAFTQYAGNPVIPNAELRDFRDPKLVFDAARGRWVCAVAAGDHVDLYTSGDFIHWQKRSEFGAAENAMGGVFECPDLVRLVAPDGGEVWMLSASMALPGENGGSRTQYFLGSFDGERFTQTERAQSPLLLDQGYDNYAAVTFNGAAEPIALGWANSWCYADALPEGEFCGQMTYARCLSLAQTECGLRLTQQPIAPRYGEARPMRELPGELFRLDIDAKGGFRIALRNDGGEEFVFGLDYAGVYYTDRTNSSHTHFSALFDSGLMSVTKTQRLAHGPVHMELHFDRCVAELFADGGLYACTVLVFPDAPYTRVEVFGDAEVSVADGE